MSEIDSLSAASQAELALRLLPIVLRFVGRQSAETGNYQMGYDAIATLLGSKANSGFINTRNRSIRTRSGGDINIFAPVGFLQMAEDSGTPSTIRPAISRFSGTDALVLKPTTAESKIPSGIVTEYGGSVSATTLGDVSIGKGRIFTLRGGDIVIWSSIGNIAAGAAAKTVATAPPTRVLVDPTTASIETDLGGLATGGGIGVLSTVEGVEAGDVDLIAPLGIVDAGDAGIRASGNLNIAAVQVLNADNISVAGSTAGVPTTAPVSSPNVGGLASASSSTAATSSAASQVAQQAAPRDSTTEEPPSLITVEVLGYGGGDSASTEDEQKEGV
jgi:hypothetical protein